MADKVVVTLGRFPLIRSVVVTTALAVIGYSIIQSESPGGEIDWFVAWMPATAVAIALAAMLHNLWLFLGRRPIAVLSPEGLRARACDNVLIPWNQVKSVTLATGTSSQSLNPNISAVALEWLTRHDVYEVLLDTKVLELGVKHSENLSTIGFKLAPFRLSVSSQDLAAAFQRHLLAERCIGFGFSEDATTAGEIARRAALAALTAAAGGLERLEDERSAKDI